MVTSEVAHQQNKDPRPFCSGAQEGKSILRRGLSPKVSHADRNSLPNRRENGSDTVRHRHRSDEGKCHSLFLTFQDRADHTLACPNISEQCIKKGLLSIGMGMGKGSEILPSVTSSGWC